MTMTQKNKELLLKDLCARLPYGVKVKITSRESKNRIVHLSEDNIYNLTDVWWSECKPYLLPLSSMTEEQKKEISKRYNYHNPYQLCVEITSHREGYWDNDNSCRIICDWKIGSTKIISITEGLFHLDWEMMQQD